MQLKIAVISDFHCHNKEMNGNVQESLLLTDQDLPTLQDPFKSIKRLISENSLKADLLIMAGDFANKADPEGLALGWTVTKEIGSLLGVEQIIPNVGNHDVDSRGKHSSDPFDAIKSLSPDFPFVSAKDNEFFWEHGYIIIEGQQYRMVVINTVHSHTNPDDAFHGLISQEAINEIEAKLSSIQDNKVNIAMCHHNPIEHSHYDTGSKDFMYNGDELISILDGNNFDLIIHGHKHDPRVRYAQGGSTPPVIFSSGSFCAFRNLLLQGAHNTFHIISIELSESQFGRGVIDTWFFVPTKGWRQEISSSYFESRIGFGARLDLRTTAQNIQNWFMAGKHDIVEWETLCQDFPELRYLIPFDFKKLKGLLKPKDIFVSKSGFDEPVYVQYKRKVASI